MEATNRRNTCIAATRCGNKFHRLNRRILLKILLQQHVAQDLLIKFSCLEDELCCCEVFAATCCCRLVFCDLIWLWFIAIPNMSIYGFIVYCIVLISLSSYHTIYRHNRKPPKCLPYMGPKRRKIELAS